MEFLRCIFLFCLVPLLVDTQDLNERYNMMAARAPPDDQTYNHAWVVPYMPYMWVRIKTCKNAWIALSERPYYSDYIYEIRLADQVDTKTFLYKGNPNGERETLVDEDTSNLVDCNEFRTFWIKWENGIIAMGEGFAIGNHPIFEYTDENPLTIAAIGFSSIVDVETLFEWLRDSVATSYINTRGNWDHGDMWISEKDRTSVVLGVKGCKSALLGLNTQYKSENDQFKQGYVVIFGNANNQRSLIKVNIGGDTKVTVETPGILSCNEYRYFWVSWKDQFIEAGRGVLVGNQRFMHWQDPNHLYDIKAATIYSGDGDIPNVWRFDLVPANSFYLISNAGATDNRDHWLNIASRSAIVFSVRCCTQAIIRLKASFAYNALNDVELLLDTSSVILRVRHFENEDDTIDYPFNDPLLSPCDIFHTFWFSWKGDIFEFGKGAVPYNKTIFSIPDPFTDFRFYLALHMGSAEAGSTSAEWIISEYAGSNTIVHSSPTTTYNQVGWYTVKGKHSVVFGVRSCYGAMIVLSEHLGNYYRGTYEILLGDQVSNTSDVFIDGTFVPVASASTPGILSCSQMRYFWLSWSSGVISVGYGFTPGSAAFLTYEDTRDQPYDIYAMAMKGSHEAEWGFGEINGNLITLKTSTGEYEHIWLTTADVGFWFAVQACDHAKLVLTKNTREIAYNSSFEIVIGNGQDVFTTISSTGMDEVNMTETPGILSCNRFQNFWVSWYDDKIRLGKGILFLADEILTLTPVYKFDISSISLTTAAADPGYWVFGRTSGKVMDVNTDGEKDFAQFMMTYEQALGISFQVKASHSAHVLLMTIPGVAQVDAFDVSIGRQDNTETTIRNASNDQELTRVDSVDILSSQEMRWFWVTWVSGLLEVGTGKWIGQNRILDYQHPTPISIHGIALSTHGSTGLWRINQMDDLNFHVRTTHGERSRALVNGVAQMMAPDQVVEFSVQACWNAVIGLYDHYLEGENTYAYEILLGAEQNTAIQFWDLKNTTAPMMQRVFPNILSCAEPRYFWIRWSEGVLQLGQGVPPMYILLEWTAPHLSQINAMVVTTVAEHNLDIGLWTIPEFAVERFAVGTIGPKDFKSFYVTTVHQTYFTFKVKACSDVWLGLSTVPTNGDQIPYTIGIGLGGGILLEIQNFGQVVQQSAVVDILDCENYRPYWVSWDGGYVEVGAGTDRGQARLIDWQDNSVDIDRPVVNLVAMTTDDVVGEWEFAGLQGNKYQVNTEGYYYDFTWLSPRHFVYHLNFEVESCNGKTLHLALSHDVGFDTQQAYEIILGERIDRSADGKVEHFDVTSIRGGINGTELVAKITRDYFTTCGQYRKFWVSWFSRHIRVGRGEAYSNELLSYLDVNATYVNHVHVLSFASPSKVYWKTGQNEVEVLHFRTAAIPYDRFWMNVMGKADLVFNVRACGHISILLSSAANNPEFQTYHIEISRSSDNRTVIYDGYHGAEQDSALVTQVLHCFGYRTFRVSWADGIIQLFNSLDEAAVPLVEWQPEQPNLITAVAVGSHLTSNAWWYMFRAAGRVYRTMTPSTRDYRGHWLYLQQKRMHFRVRSCKDIGILLMTREADGWGVDNYEIIIGGWENGQSAIKRYYSLDNLVAVPTPNILSCDDFRSFWMSWQSDHLEVGVGEVGDTTFLSVPLPENADMHAVSFGSLGVIAEWEFDNYEDETLLTTSPGGWLYNTSWISVMDTREFKFYVRAGHSAHLALATIPGQTHTAAHEIVLGLEDNTASVIRSSVGGEEVARVTIADILSATEYREFWVTWSYTHIRVGRGGFIGTDQILEWVNLPITPIHSIGLSTGITVDGYWIHGNISDTAAPNVVRDDYVVAHTDGSGQFLHQWSLPVEYLIFTVRGCQEAVLALSAVPALEEYESYQIILGAEDNQAVKFTKYGAGPFSKVIPVPNTLSCVTSRDFWIVYSTKIIVIGYGRVLGDDQIGDFEDNNMPILNAASITSLNGHTARWVFYKSVAHEFNFTTSSDHYTYDQTWMTVNNADSLVFYVKASNDPHIVLSDRLERLGNVYEVALGIIGNTRSVIRYCPQCYNAVNVDTPDIVSSEEERPFWIKWGLGVEVGTGTVVGANRFMALHDAVGKNIVALGISTGWGATGEWRIVNAEVDNIQVRILHHDLSTDHHAWIFEDKNYFEFSVRSCSSAVVYLSQDPLVSSVNDTTGFEITIGAQSNSMIHLRKYPTFELIQTAQTPGVLSCFAYRKFWITWYNGDLIFGSGSLLTRSLMIHSEPAVVVRTISLMTQPSASDAYFEFSKSAGKSVVLFTMAEFSQAYLNWIDVVGKDSIVFKVRACEAAIITLAQWRAVPSFNTYEVILDGWQGTKSAITYSGNTMAEYTEEQVLDCNLAKWFWISWSDVEVHVGRGPDVGGDVIMAWDNIVVSHPVTSISLVASGQDAYWELSELGDNLWEVQTPARSISEDDYFVWMTLQRHFFTFQVKTSGPAVILLAELPRNTTYNVYEIRIGDGIKTRIVDRSSGAVLAEEDTPSVVDPTLFNEFWISWFNMPNGRHINVGRGELFTNELVSYDDPDPYPVHALSLSTTESATGDWIFPKDSGMQYHFYTPNYYSSEGVLSRVFTESSVVFAVKTAHDAHVDLFDHYHTDSAYQVVFGARGNQNTLIRKNRLGISEVEVSSPNITSATQYRQFWVSWRDGIVAAGFGEIPGVLELLRFVDPNPISVSYMAISTGFGADGHWWIENIPENTFLLQTLPIFSTDTFLVNFIQKQNVYAFSVRACSNALVYLRSGGLGSTRLYDILIGAEDNTKIQIRKGGEEGILYEALAPNVLSCLEYRWFVLQWQDNYIEILQTDYNGRSIFSYTDNESVMDNIHSLVVGTSAGRGADWGLPGIAAAGLTYFHLFDISSSYCCMWMTTVDRYVMAFNVRACYHASVLLSEIPGVARGNAYEIVIGNDFNTHSEIRLGLNGTIVAEADTAQTLSCTEYRQFWVSWFNNVVAVGIGALPGQQRIMYWKDPVGFKVAALSVESRDIGGSTWDFSIIEGNSYNIKTPNSYAYHRAIMVPNQNVFRFSVEACNDAHISLSTIPGNVEQTTYEIVLGGWSNDKSEIRNGPQGLPLATVSTPEILDCQREKKFWVGWDNRGVYVGSGDIPYNRMFMSYNGTGIYQINAIALSTGWEAEGEWNIPIEQESVVKFRMPETDADTPDGQWMTVAGYLAIVFRVKACQDARVLLATYARNVNGMASEVVIGADNNQKSYIRETVDGPIVEEQDTPQYLDCNEFRAFHIIWSPFEIMVGLGSNLMDMRTIFMSYRSSSLHFIQAIGFMNSQATTIEYELSKLAGDTYTVNTLANHNYDRLLIKTSKKIFVFRVKTCMDAHIALTPNEASGQSGYYEIVIGGYGNTYTDIRKVPLGVMVHTPSLDILSCDAYRYFWVSWFDSDAGGIDIAFGGGLVPGVLQLMHWHDEDPYPISNIAIATWFNSPGTWEMHEDSGSDDEIFFTTQDIFDYNTAHVTYMGRKDMRFRVQACQSAHVALSAIPGVADVLTYEIVIGANQNSELLIRSDGQVLATRAITGLLDCNELREFWLSWSGQVVRIGRGDTAFEDELLSAADATYPFQSISFATFVGVQGLWQITTDLPAIPGPTLSLLPTASTSTTTTPRPPDPSPSNSPSSTTDGSIEQPNTGGGLSDGEAVGVAFGVIIGVLLLGAVAFFAYRERHRFYGCLPGSADDETSPVVFDNPTYAGGEGNVSFQMADKFYAAPGPEESET